MGKLSCSRKKFVYEEKNFLPLVVKKAKEAWLRLPPQTRVWLSLEDMIQDGLMYVRFRLLPRYKPSKNKFSTLVWMALENHFKLVTYHYYYQKRFEGRNAPLPEFGLSCSVKPKHSHELHAIEALEKVFKSSTPHLQTFLAR